MYFKRAHQVETQQNIELMTFGLTWCANIFVGCSVTPTFFGRSLPFLILSIILRNNKNLWVGSFNYFSYTIQITSNWYMDTVVHDLEVAFFMANSTWFNDICSKTQLVEYALACNIELWSTWEVWRALKKQELPSTTPRATLASWALSKLPKCSITR